MKPNAFPVEQIRAMFPAFSFPGVQRPRVLLDGPAGSQVPQPVIDAMVDYLIRCNANRGGRFPSSIESDELLSRAHGAVADFLGANDPDEIVFGANMTTLTFALSRSLARTWKPGDEIVVTRLDHDANVAPWIAAAEEAGAIVKKVGVRPEDCTLDVEELSRHLSWRTRFVAIGAASNAVGTVQPVRRIAQMVHAYGAELFVDAVHYAPHRRINVADWDCDYLACSAYKFFGPHVGVLWGKRERLESLPAIKVRPAGNSIPDRWMTGTQNHEGIAGVAAAIDYIASIAELADSVTTFATRANRLDAAFSAVQTYENELCVRLVAGLQSICGIRVLGITECSRFDERAPTVSFVHDRMPAAQIAEALGEQGICVWHGNFYAMELSESLGLEPNGMVRVGLLHYNTVGEVDAFLESLRRLAS